MGRLGAFPTKISTKISTKFLLNDCGWSLLLRFTPVCSGLLRFGLKDEHAARRRCNPQAGGLRYIGLLWDRPFRFGTKSFRFAPLHLVFKIGHLQSGEKRPVLSSFVHFFKSGGS
jgi:hypothetical protein